MSEPNNRSRPPGFGIKGIYLQLKDTLILKALADFVTAHIGDDISKLILNSGRWPEIDMETAVNCIESRRKLKGKVQEWYDEPMLVFPLKLSAEQCSSSATGEYKASLAERIIQAEEPGREFRIADLTGGLGVDSWYFSKKAVNVLYNEMQSALCKAAEHNFHILGADNISIKNSAVGINKEEGACTPSELLSGFKPDIIYMDPARRGEGGKKVFLIEECTPDVITLKNELFAICKHIMIKLSPMADISMVCERLGKTCREIHVVASGGECKELLIWMDRDWCDEYSIHAVELNENGVISSFVFRPSEEKEATATIFDPSVQMEGLHLFEPGKSLMKAGAFNLISTKSGIGKIGRSTHYYICKDEVQAKELRKYGKIHQIIRCSPLDKRSIKEAGKDFPKAEVTARNLPMDTDTLRKKLGVSSGDRIHIFGLKSDIKGNLLIISSNPS